MLDFHVTKTGLVALDPAILDVLGRAQSHRFRLTNAEALRLVAAARLHPSPAVQVDLPTQRTHEGPSACDAGPSTTTTNRTRPDGCS